MDRRAWWATGLGVTLGCSERMEMYSLKCTHSKVKNEKPVSLASTHLPTPNKDTIFPDSVIINETKKLFLDFVIKFLIVKGQFCFLE